MSNKRNTSVKRNVFKPLPQIGPSTENCKPVENLLNDLGAYGTLVIGVTTHGHNGRDAFAMFAETPYRWQYKVVSCNMKDPLLAEQKIFKPLGEQGWMCQAIYSQGANNYATAAVFIRPAGKIEQTNELAADIARIEAERAQRRALAKASQSGPEQQDATGDSEPPVNSLNDDEGSGNHVAQGALETAAV